MKQFVKFAAVAVCSASLMACGASRESGWERETAAVSGDEAAFLQEAEAAWAERGTKEKLEAAIDLYEKASQVNPGNLDTLSRLARAYYFLADAHFKDDQAKQIEVWDLGIAAGERALAHDEGFKAADDHFAPETLDAMDAKYAPAMYWTASNLGKWAKAQGFVTLLKQKGKVKALVESVTKKQPEYFYHAPDRYWGVYYSVAPSFAGGDMDKSKEHYEASIAGSPDYLGTKVLYADTWASKQLDNDLYVKLLQEVLDAPVDSIPELIPEQESEKDKARRMLAPEEIEERFE